MPTLVLKFGESIKNRFAFEKSIVTIGRSSDNDIVVENLAVSRKHAKIEKVGEAFVLSDMQSANGTFVNGERVNRRPLKHFDSITVGKHQVVFLEDPKVQPAMDDEPMSPFDLDRTVVVNPGAPRPAAPPRMDLTPPREEKMPALEIPAHVSQAPEPSGDYVASFMSQVYHSIKCDWVQGIKGSNRVYFKDQAEAEKSGRRNCRICMPGQPVTQPNPEPTVSASSN